MPSPKRTEQTRVEIVHDFIDAVIDYAGTGMTADTPDEARDALDALLANLESVEARVRELEEASGAVIEALGWDGTLKLGYNGGASDVEEFEESMHELARVALKEARQ